MNSRDKIDAPALHASPARGLEVAGCSSTMARMAAWRTTGGRCTGYEAYCDKEGFGVAQLLIERVANVDTPDNDYVTPLYLASPQRLVSLELA